MENQNKSVENLGTLNNSEFKKTLRREINRALIIILLIGLFISLIENWGDVKHGWNEGFNSQQPVQTSQPAK